MFLFHFSSIRMCICGRITVRSSGDSVMNRYRDQLIPCNNMKITFNSSSSQFCLEFSPKNHRKPEWKPKKHLLINSDYGKLPPFKHQNNDEHAHMNKIFTCNVKTQKLTISQRIYFTNFLWFMGFHGFSLFSLFMFPTRLRWKMVEYGRVWFVDIQRLHEDDTQKAIFNRLTVFNFLCCCFFSSFTCGKARREQYVFHMSSYHDKW